MFVSDLHGMAPAPTDLPCVLVGDIAGDVAGQEAAWEKFFANTEQIYFVRGNHDTPIVSRTCPVLSRLADVDITGNIALIKGILVAGFGWTGREPKHLPSDEELQEVADALRPQIRVWRGNGPVIIASHYHVLMDYAANPGFERIFKPAIGGSSALTRLVDTLAPNLVVMGHIHGWRGKRAKAASGIQYASSVHGKAPGIIDIPLSQNPYPV
jgi:Icc-related predicted phosphoesterase